MPLLRRELIRTPAGHQGILIEPPGLVGLLEGGTGGRSAHVRLIDLSLGDLRKALRQRLNLVEPVVATGHQAEFFHAGVFAKTVAIDELAARTGSTGIFLTVDSDTPKSERLTAPVAADGELHRGVWTIPGLVTDRPTESCRSVPSADWNVFFDDVADRAVGSAASMMETFRRGFLGERTGGVDFATGIEAGQAAVERGLGLRPCRAIRISALSETLEFRAFVGHLAVSARATATAYNAAVASYRRRNRVRAVGRPVPELLVEHDRTEIPFWLLGPDHRRHRMFVSADGPRIAIWAEGTRIAAISAELTAKRADEEFAALRRDGWRIRPRALTLSGFARLALCDLFIHGIGGAKYDEVTDEFMSALFGEALAPLACVTATLRLVEDATHAPDIDWREAQRRVRDVRHNPQRQIAGLPIRLLTERGVLLTEVLRLRREEPRRRAARRAAYRALREKNAELLALRPNIEAELTHEAHAARQAWEAAQVGLDREYFYALHSRGALAELVNGIRAVVR